jgi:hypothetical protein
LQPDESKSVHQWDLKYERLGYAAHTKNAAVRTIRQYLEAGYRVLRSGAVGREMSVLDSSGGHVNKAAVRMKMVTSQLGPVVLTCYTGGGPARDIIQFRHGQQQAARSSRAARRHYPMTRTHPVHMPDCVSCQVVTIFAATGFSLPATVRSSSSLYSLMQTLQPKDTPVDYSWKEMKDLQEILDEKVDPFQLVDGVRTCLLAVS